MVEVGSTLFSKWLVKLQLFGVSVGIAIMLLVEYDEDILMVNVVSIIYLIIFLMIYLDIWENRKKIEEFEKKINVVNKNG